MARVALGGVLAEGKEENLELCKNNLQMKQRLSGVFLLGALLSHLLSWD